MVTVFLGGLAIYGIISGRAVSWLGFSVGSAPAPQASGASNKQQTSGPSSPAIIGNDNSVTYYRDPQAATSGQTAGIKRDTEKILEILGDRYPDNRVVLAARYPLGFEVFYSDGHALHGINGSTLPKGVELDWKTASMDFAHDPIMFRFPNIVDKERRITTDGVSVGLPREKGATTEFPIVGLFPFTLEVEVLGIGKSTTLGVIGVLPVTNQFKQ